MTLTLKVGQQHLFQAFLSLPPSPFQDHVDGVEEGVERRVERQHEDGHGHAHRARYREALSRQDAQQADGEPAQEAGHGDGDEAAGDGQVFGLLGRVGGRDGVGADGQEDGHLAGSDEHEEAEVHDDDDAEGVGVAGEVTAADGQRDADARLAVEAPMGEGGQQGHGR